MAHIIIEEEIACPPEAALARIYRAFGGDQPGSVTRTLSVPFSDLGLPNIGALEKEVVVTLGEPNHESYLTRVPLSWSVPNNGAFPVFEGFFEIQPEASWQIQLAIIGDYNPPMGALGAVFDAAAGRKIAEATIRHLLDEVSRVIQDPVTPLPN